MSTHRNALTWVGLAAAALTVTGCASAAQKLGLNSQAPDEFRTVAKAPLVVPPDYALSPRAPPASPCSAARKPSSAARARACWSPAPAAARPIHWSAMWWTTSSATSPIRTRASPTG